MTRLVAALLLALLAARPGRAYVTSAYLEIMADDKAGIYLNGEELLSPDKCEVIFLWFKCLSTTDGTLPLSLFKNNAENVLGVLSFDMYGGKTQIAYRLTVHHSTGDPVVVWGEPGQTRFLNVKAGKKLPLGWSKSGFDDSQWPFAVERQLMGSVKFDQNIFSLPDSHFDGMLKPGKVPILAPKASGDANAGEMNLYRSSFRFPNSLSKPKLLLNPAKANQGQAVAMRALPGGDATDLQSYSLSVQMPKGLGVTKISQGGRYDAAAQSVTWSYSKLGEKVRYQALHAASLAAPSKWLNPERALGPYKPEIMLITTPVPTNLMDSGARMYPGQETWFKMSPPHYDPASPGRITGVMFKLQCRIGGQDLLTRKGADHMFMNYSIDGGFSPAFKDEVQIDHAVNGGHWSTGYYEASEDRAWTWEDLSRLKVRIASRAFGTVDQGRVASVVVSVRSVAAEEISPVLYTQVTDPRCATLPLRVNVTDYLSNITVSDMHRLEINPGACPPPTATPAPPPPPVVVAGQPTPTPAPPGKRMNPTTIGLGCMANAPEPFNHAGTFLSFCLKVPAQVALEVHDAKGRILRRTEYLEFRQGDNQLFYNGLDDAGKPLPSGRYSYFLKARSEDAFADYHAGFTKAQGKRR